MMKKTILFLLTTLWVLAAPAQVQKDFLAFDQAFIPVWYHVYGDQLPEAVNALPALRLQWQRLQQSFVAQHPGDRFWKETVIAVNDRLEEAEDALSEHRTDLAYNQIDLIKYELMEARRRNRLVYVLDDWYDLHERVFEVTCIAGDDLLDLLEWNEFVHLTRQMENHWQGLRPSDPGMDTETWPPALQQQGQAFDEALLKYLEAVESADQATVQEQEKPFNDAVFNLLAAFGIFDQDAILFIK